MIMRAISKRTFRNISYFAKLTIFSFTIIVLICNVLVSLFLVLAKLNVVSKSVNITVNSIILSVVVLLFCKDVISVLTSGILVIKSIRQSIERVKQTTKKTEGMENPFIVTFSLLVGLIICILLQIVSATVATAYVSEREEFKFAWHFVNCAGILVFACLTLALFYPMFIQTES